MKKLITLLMITILAISSIACSSDTASEDPSNETPTNENPISEEPAKEDLVIEKPEGDPLAVIETYYTHIDNSEYEDAYNLLSEELKGDVDLETYSLWYTLFAQTSPGMTYEFTLLEEKEESDLDNIEFPYINKYNINKSWTEAYTDQPATFDTEEYVVAENNEWRVYRLKDDFDAKTKIASNYQTLGMIYSYGRGVEADQNIALGFFQNAIKYNDTNSYYYFSMSNTLLALERFDEAETAANKALELLEVENDPNMNQSLANTNNVLGVINQRRGDTDKAKEYYSRALELYPDNVEARENLKGLE